MKRMKILGAFLLSIFFIFFSRSWQAIGGPLKDSVLKPTSGKASPAFSSDLSIEKMDCRGCSVHILIKNLGRGEVHNEDYKNGKLMVEVQGIPGAFSFPLKKVDPNKELVRAGGSVRFNTKIWCGKKIKVKAHLAGLKHDGVRGKKVLEGSFFPHPSCKAEKGIPSFEIPPRLTEKIKGCDYKLTNLRKTVEGLLTVRTIKEEQVVNFEERILNYVSELRESFEVAVEEIKKGNPQALLKFESMAKDHSKRIKEMLSLVRTVEGKIKRGEMLPDGGWLRRLSLEQREEFLRHLTPEGRGAVERAYPRLFRKREGFLKNFLEAFLSIRSAEASIFKPCLDPCNITYEEVWSFVGSEEARERFWEEASQECKNCVNEKIPQAAMAFQEFKNCSSNCEKIYSHNPLMLLFDFLCRMQCLYKLIVAIA